MNNGIIFLIWIFSPFIFAIFSFVAALAVPAKRLEKNILVELVILLFRFVAFDHKAISEYRGTIARGLFIALGFAFLLYPTVRDYSSFIPSRFSMEIFFDQIGLDNVLGRLDKESLRQLNLENDWISQRAAYFDRLNHHLLDNRINFEFLIQGPATVGTGSGIFKVAKVSLYSQKYKIMDASGTILFRTPGIGGDDAPTLLTGYKLVESADSYLDENPFSVYRTHSILAKPEFSQFVRLTPTNITFDRILVAATFISVPLFSIDQTIYLAHEKNGKNIPIGYAIIAPED